MLVPYADAGPLKIPEGLSDEQVLFLSDIFPTGFMAADFCGLKGGETVAVWGCPHRRPFDPDIVLDDVTAPVNAPPALGIALSALVP
jgi:hypothetical protein